MKNIFNAISAAIEALPAIRWVDFDLGQLAQQPLPPVSWPCALVRFDSAAYTRIGNEDTTGVLSIEVVLGFLLRERTHSLNDPAFREEAIAHLDTVELVRRAVSGLKGEDFTDLAFMGFSNDARPDLRVWRLRFECQHWPDANTDPPGGTNVFQPWPGPGTGPNFCAHPDLVLN